MFKRLLGVALFTLTACSPSSPPPPLSEVAHEELSQLSKISGTEDFGMVSGSKTVIFQIRNTGDSASEIPTPALTGTQAAAFAIVQSSGCAAALPKNGTCTIRINFNANGKSGGNYFANLKVGTTFNLAISAAVASPPAAQYAIYDGAVQLSSALGLNFGNLTGSQTLQKILTIKNTGAVSSPALSLDLTNNSFAISNSTCESKILQAGQSCSFKILFSTSGKSPQVYLSDLLFDNQVFPLTGTVTAPLANNDPNSGVIIETFVNNEPLTAADLNLGILPNNQGIVKVITFKNVGSATSTPMTAALSENGNFFIISNLCQNKILAPQASCSFRLVFSAISKNAGAYNVELNFPGVELPITGEVLPTAECPVDTHLEAPVCVSNFQACVIDNGIGQRVWNGSIYGDCVIVSCNPSFHAESGSCVNNTRECIIANGQGQEIWNGSGYETCAVQACDNSYHPENNTCVSDVRSCAIANGAGSQTWLGNQYSACTVQSCDASFHQAANACESNTQDCANEIAHASSAIKTWNGSAFGSCQVQACASLYHVEANACADNIQDCSAEIEHAAAATKTWSGSAYGACLVSSCVSGYEIQSNTCVSAAPSLTIMSSVALDSYQLAVKGVDVFFDSMTGTYPNLSTHLHGGNGNVPFAQLLSTSVPASSERFDGLQYAEVNGRHIFGKGIYGTSDMLPTTLYSVAQNSLATPVLIHPTMDDSAFGGSVSSPLLEGQYGREGKVPALFSVGSKLMIANRYRSPNADPYASYDYPSILISNDGGHSFSFVWSIDATNYSSPGGNWAPYCSIFQNNEFYGTPPDKNLAAVVLGSKLVFNCPQRFVMIDANTGTAQVIMVPNTHLLTPNASITKFNNKAYAIFHQQGTGRPQLFSIDEAGNVALVDAAVTNQNYGELGENNKVVLNNKLYVRMIKNEDPSYFQIFSYDAAGNKTLEAEDLLYTSGSDTDSFHMGYLNGRLLYTTYDDTTSQFLWKAKSVSGTEVIGRSEVVYKLGPMYYYNGLAYFASMAPNDVGGFGYYYLTKTDGTPAGTSVVMNMALSNFEMIKVGSDGVYFQGRDQANPASGPRKIYKYTEAVTHLDEYSAYLQLALPLSGADNGTLFQDQAIAGRTSALKTIAYSGGVRTSTALSKFYGSSTKFNGNGYLIANNNGSDFAFGTGDFTVEFWINSSLIQSDKFLTGFRGGGVGAGFIITVGGFPGSGAAGSLRAAGISSGDLNSSTIITDGAWHHCAVTRAGGVITLWIDGVAEDSGIDTSSYNGFANSPAIGANDYNLAAGFFDGYLQDLRIYKGVSKYSSNFTPPASLK